MEEGEWDLEIAGECKRMLACEIAGLDGSKKCLLVVEAREAAAAAASLHRDRRAAPRFL